MTARRYVYEVTKRLTCTKNKRREIKEKLLQEISSAKEGGEEVNVVLERMGDPKDVARRYNIEFLEPEKKAFIKERRIKRIVSFVVVLVVISALAYWAIPKSAPIGSSGMFTQEAVEEKAKQVVECLGRDDLEGLKSDATEKMKQAIDADMIDSVREQISTDWGEFQTIGKIYTAEMKQRGERLAVAQVVATYENINVTYTLSFDEDMKLAGLYMK